MVKWMIIIYLILWTPFIVFSFIICEGWFNALAYILFPFIYWGACAVIDGGQ